MNLTKVKQFATANFSALISADELVQVNNNTFSVIDVHTGFCKHFHFLKQVPNGFYMNPLIPNKTVLTFPGKGSNSETLSVIDTYTGEVFRNISLHGMKEQFGIVAVGTNVYFTIKSNPNVLYFMQFSEGQIAQFDAGGKITHICPNQEENQFIIIKDNRNILNLSCKDCSKIWERPVSNPLYIKYIGNFLVLGLVGGEIDLITDNPLDPRIIKTPHGTDPIDTSEIVSITKDGVVFTNDTQSQVAIHTNAKQVFSKDLTICVICRSQTHIYEVTKPPLASSYDLQPGMPFHNDTASIPSFSFFAVQNVLYEYSIDGDSISKFTTLQSGTIEKVVSTNSAVSIVYKVGEERKIQIFITGTKQRDEVGIDVCVDKEENTWVLQQDAVYQFTKQGISILQKQKIQLPPEHVFDRIVPIKDTVALYRTETGDAAYLDVDHFVSFNMPPNIVHFKWPALCTSDKVYMCQNDSVQPDQLTLDCFISIDMHVTSCLWFAWTFFAVEGNKLYGIGRNGSKRVIEKLPNSATVISSVTPLMYVMVTTIPQISIFIINKPVVLDTLPDCRCSLDSLPRFLSFVPSQPIDAHALAGTDPLVAFSVVSKTGVASLSPPVIDLYAKFGHFDELLSIARKQEAPDDVLLALAEKARVFGQFEVARQLYEQLGEFEKLFELFVILRSQENLKVLGTRPGMEPLVRFLGFEPHPGQFEPVINLDLPRTKQPIKFSMDYTLFFGDPLDQKQIFPSSFDEISNFGVRQRCLTGEEAESAAASNAQNLLEEKKEEPTDQEANKDIVYKEKPKEDTQMQSTKLSLDDFFTDDKDSTEGNKPLISEIVINTTPINKPPSEKKPKINVGFQLQTTTNSSTRRRSGTTRIKKPDSLDFDLPDLSKRAQVVKIPEPPSAQDVSASADPTGSIPPFPSTDDTPEGSILQDTPEPTAPKPSDFQSTLFLDFN